MSECVGVCIYILRMYQRNELFHVSTRIKWWGLGETSEDKP